MKHSLFVTAFATASLLAFAGGASAASLIDFNDFARNTIINPNTTVAPGVSLSVNNANPGAPDVGIIVDFSDPTLRPFGLRQPFRGGNLPAGTNFGNGLGVKAESGPLFVEGRRPAGSIFIDFDFDITSFGFDVIDVDGPEEFQTDSGFFVEYLNNDTVVADFFFGELITPGNSIYDASIEFGDDTINRITLPAFSDGFNRVRIALGGSAAVDNFTYEPKDGTNPVPTPAAVGGGLALLAALMLRRRQA